VLALTGIHWREAWKYGLRAYRYGQHDGGPRHRRHRLRRRGVGRGGHGCSRWGDADLAALLGWTGGKISPTPNPKAGGGLWVGPEPPPMDLSPGRLVRGLVFTGRANRLSDAQVAWPGIEAVARAAQRPTTVPLPAFQAPSRPPLAESGCPARAATLIRQRRSAVAFDG